MAELRPERRPDWPEGHRPDAGVGRGHHRHRRGPHREPVESDTRRIDARAGAEPAELRLHVLALLVAPGGDPSFTLAAGAGVEEQHPVAVVQQEGCLGEELGTVGAEAVDQRHRRSVPARGEPPPEQEPVVGPELDLLIPGSARRASARS